MREGRFPGWFASEGGDPKDILFDVVVADFEFGVDFFSVRFVAVVVGRIEVVVVCGVSKTGFDLFLADIKSV